MHTYKHTHTCTWADTHPLLKLPIAFKVSEIHDYELTLWNELDLGLNPASGCATGHFTSLHGSPLLVNNTHDRRVNVRIRQNSAH